MTCEGGDLRIVAEVLRQSWRLGLSTLLSSFGFICRRWSGWDIDIVILLQRLTVIIRQ